VVLRSPVVLGKAPLGFNEASSGEAVQCRVKRSLVNEEDRLRGALDPLRHCISVLRPCREGLQDQEIEALAKDVQFRFAHCLYWRTSPLSGKGCCRPRSHYEQFST